MNRIIFHYLIWLGLEKKAAPFESAQFDKKYVFGSSKLHIRSRVHLAEISTVSFFYYGAYIRWVDWYRFAGDLLEWHAFDLVQLDVHLKWRLLETFVCYEIKTYIFDW